MASKTILLVSDSHEGYANLEKIIETEGSQVDYIIHSGDFGTIMEEEKHLPEIQQKGLTAYQSTIDILKRAGKPIFCVPGNVLFT